MDVKNHKAASRLAILLAAALALLAAGCSGGSETPEAGGASGNWDELVWDAGNWQ